MSDQNQHLHNIFNNSENEVENEGQNEMKESDELLIETVKAYPHLYNHKDSNFKNHLLKKKSWKEIALTVNAPVLVCQNRWTRLRERFGKETRKQSLKDSKNNNEVERRSVFAYHEKMSFLNDHIKRRRSYKSVSIPKCLKVEMTVNEPHIPSVINLSKVNKDRQDNLLMNKSIVKDIKPISSVTSNETNRPSSTGLRRLLPKQPVTLHRCNESPRSSTFSAELESSLILLCQTVQKRLQDNRNFEMTSTDEIFAKLIMDQLEKLPPNEKQKRQQKIMQILYEPYDS